MRYKIKDTIIIRYLPYEIVLADFSKPGMEWYLFENTDDIEENLNKMQEGSFSLNEFSHHKGDVKKLLNFLVEKRFIVKS